MNPDPTPTSGDVMPYERPVATIARLLAVPDLRLSCVVAGDSLDVPVRWIHSTELLDPSPYLRGGELVCTVGSSIHGDVDATAFVDAIVRSRAAGICFGVGDVHEQVPEGLRSACAGSGLPLLSAPRGVPFMAIGEYVAEQRSGAETAHHASEQRLIADLLARVRAGARVQELLENAASSIGGRWDFVDGDLSYGAGAAEGEPVVSVTPEDGLRLAWRGSGSAPEPALLLTVAHLLDVCRHEADLESALQRERVGELLNLVSERLALPAALEASLAGSGLDPDRLVFSAWTSGAGRLLASALEGVPFVLGESPRTCILISGDALPIEDTARRIGLPCGHSRVVTLSEAAQALREAQAAFDLAQRHGGVMTPSDLTTLEGLLVQQPSDRLEPFVDRLLEPLLRSDRTRGTRHITTLRAYIESGASLVDTARAQYLHVNTVRHRLQQVHALSGRDPFVLADRIDLMIALWALDHWGR